jgi:lipase chaperone LimK
LKNNTSPEAILHALRLSVIQIVGPSTTPAFSLGSLGKLARAHAPDAIRELALLAVKAKSELARVAAIRELLDRGFGKSTQFLATHAEL